MGREYSLCKNKTLFLDIATHFLVLSEETQSIFGKEKIMVKSGSSMLPRDIAFPFLWMERKTGSLGQLLTSPQQYDIAECLS